MNGKEYSKFLNEICLNCDKLYDCDVNYDEDRVKKCFNNYLKERG